MLIKMRDTIGKNHQLFKDLHEETESIRSKRTF